MGAPLHVEMLQNDYSDEPLGRAECSHAFRKRGSYPAYLSYENHRYLPVLLKIDPTKDVVESLLVGTVS